MHHDFPSEVRSPEIANDEQQKWSVEHKRCSKVW